MLFASFGEDNLERIRNPGDGVGIRDIVVASFSFLSLDCGGLLGFSFKKIMHVRAEFGFAAPDQQIAILFHSTDHKKALGFGGLEEGLIKIKAVDQDIDFGLEIFRQLKGFEDVNSQSRQFLKRTFQRPGGFTIQVQANRIGSYEFTTAQVKTIQEVITLIVFSAFSVLYLKETLKWNYFVGFFFMAVAVFLMFKKW